MTQVRDKRTADVRQYDIDCSLLLSVGETVTSVTSISADQGGVTFSGSYITVVPITYPDGHVAPAGQVVQIIISGGVIPASVAFLVCTLRVLVLTNLNAAVEATVLLRLVNTPNI